VGKGGSALPLPIESCCPARTQICHLCLGLLTAFTRFGSASWPRAAIFHRYTSWARSVSEYSDRFDQIPDCIRSFSISSAYSSPECAFQPQQLFLVSFENCRMECYGLRSGSFILQFFRRYAFARHPAWWTEARVQLDLRGLSLSHQSVDLAVQLAKLLFQCKRLFSPTLLCAG